MAKDPRGVSFEGLRKEAKRWLRAIRGGDGAALERLEKVLPKHSAELGLRQVQQALAREHGLESWAALKEHSEIASLETRPRADLIEEFLERACIYSSRFRDFADKWRRAERIRVSHPEIATAKLHTAVVCGEVEHVAGLLQQNPGLIAEKGGKQQWEPLLFVCYSRLPYANAEERALEMARLLLDAGADPNTSFVASGEGWSVRFNALTGVMGEGEMGQPAHARAEELARLLLDRGAHPNDSQGLYNTHLAGDETRWLELLFSYGLSKDDPVNWDPAPPKPDEKEPGLILSYLAAQAAHNGHIKRLECLLEHGADPNAKSGYTGKTCYQEAVIWGRREIADLLLRHGARAEPVEGRDAFVAACNAGSADEARRLLKEHPEYLRDVEVFDVLLNAARDGTLDTLKLVLELGMDPNRTGKHGHRALNQGAHRRDVCELLWQYGADPRARAFGGTVADWASNGEDLEMARVHAEKSRLLLDAVATGHIALAKELLSADPACLSERTPAGDGPLHRLPKDPDRAQELIELLLARGADPEAVNDAGKTAAQKLDAEGLDQIADLLEAARG